MIIIGFLVNYLVTASHIRTTYRHNLFTMFCLFSLESRYSLVLQRLNCFFYVDIELLTFNSGLKNDAFRSDHKFKVFF